MKNSQSYLETAYQRVAGWGKNAGAFVQRHPYLMGGLVGGALLSGGAMLQRFPPELHPARHPYTHALRTPHDRTHHEAVATMHAPMARPVLLGNMRRLSEP